MSNALVEIARIKGPNGLNGKMLISPSGVLPEGLCTFKQIMIGRQGAPRRVVSCRPARKKQFVVELEGITSADQVHLIIGDVLCVRREWLPEPASGEVYGFEMLGFVVSDLCGRELGQVVSVFNNGSHDVLVVDEEKEYLIPVISGIIREVSPEERTVTVDDGLLDGLLD